MDSPARGDAVGSLVTGAISMVLFFIGMWSGCQKGNDSANRRWQREAIEHGYAEHDSKTGKWQWKGSEVER